MTDGFLSGAGWAAATMMGALIALAPGCGDPLVDGEFAGDATVRLHGVVAGSVGSPTNARVGALWLGYSAATAPAAGVEATVLPVSSLIFPPSFFYDVLGPPPSVGQYATFDARIIPAAVRFAAFILFDDRNFDGAVTVDASGRVAAPDRLLARAQDHLLLFVETPPVEPTGLNGVGTLLLNWEQASRGYHLVNLTDAVTLHGFSGRIIDLGTAVTFLPAPDQLVFPPS